MKVNTLLFLSAFLILLSSGQTKKVDAAFVISQFKENSQKIERAEYNVQRIDTFPDGDVWNNKGFALLERNDKDEIFKFSFYGKRNDDEKAYLYDNGNGFLINSTDKNYRLVYAGGILGSPGGQMVVENIFDLDNTYKTVELLEDENKYILRYSLEPEKVYDITDREKTVELRKQDFFPIKITYREKNGGDIRVTQHILSDIRINNAVSKSISDYKDLISNYDVIQLPVSTPNKILNLNFPLIKLKNLLNENEIVNLEFGQLMLLDFWEVWCSPCIKSLPQVEELHKKYQHELRVVGIVSQNKERAKKALENKNVSFVNLIGTKNLLGEYNVDSFPRYFLIDKEGIVKKEYYGFSDEIEQDIKSIISE